MRLYHAQVQFEDRHEIDPKTGRVERYRDEIVGPSSLERIKPAGSSIEFVRASDGSFEIPEEFARDLLAKQGWFAGAPARAVTEPAAPVAEPIVVKVEAPKRRGRPPGSKNAPKAEASVEGDLPVHSVSSAV